STADVTATARLNTLNDGVATVADDGVVTTTGRGETAIMVRHLGRVAVARVTVPYQRLARYPGRPRSVPIPRANFIDDLVIAKWRRMGLLPSGLCSDEEFVRRAYLDAIGTLPTPDQVRSFLADCAPSPPREGGPLSARARLIDQLLARPEYVDYWTLK